MIKYLMNLSGITPFARKQIEYLVQTAGRFSSHIMYVHQCRTINGKSMLGLLSLGATGDAPVQVIVEGEDEEKAAATLKKILEDGVISPRGTEDALQLLARVKSAYADILDDRLAGLYVYGSLAYGCFRWEMSDIDILLAVKSDPGLEKRVKLARVLAELEEDAPPKGFELNVLLEKDCAAPATLMPYILRYGRENAEEFRTDPERFCRRARGTDDRLIRYIAALKTADITLLGPAPARMFGPVAAEDCLASMRLELADAPEALHDRPVYYVLNICRALAYRQGNGMLSKVQCGQWALKRLDQAYQGIVQAALNAYQSGTDMFYDHVAAEDFVDEYLPQIMKKEAEGEA